MSPEDDSFEMNPNLERDVKRDLDAKAQRVVDGIAGEHTGEAQADIRAALDRGLSEIGLVPPAEHEETYYRQNTTATTVAASVASLH